MAAESGDRVIVVLPNRRESIGDTVRKWTAMGFALSNRGKRIVAVPLKCNVVTMMSRRRSTVAAVFEFAERERT